MDHLISNLNSDTIIQSFLNSNEVEDSHYNDIPIIEGYQYPTDDLIALKDLLEKWNLGCLYQTCIDQLIDLKVLACMNSNDVQKLLEKFPLGIQILFRHELGLWQNNQKKNINLNENNSFKNDSIQTFESLPPCTEKIYTAPSKLNYTIQVGEILNSCTRGNLIIDYYKKNNRLNDGIRTTLVEVLISHMITNNIPMSVNISESIADQIVTMFSSEVKDVYFLKIGSHKNPKGKLYAKYYNSMRNLKNNGLVPITPACSKNTQSFKTNHRSIERTFEPEENIEDILDILKHDTTLSYPELESYWRATINYRLNDIKHLSTVDIFKKWKQYLIPYGHKLIDIDCDTLFQTKNSIYNDFQTKSEKIFNIFESKIKDLNCLKILDQIKNGSDINENVKNAAMIHLLHGMFAPTSKKITIDHNGKKNLIKYSIKDSQDTLMMFGESVDAMQTHLLRLRKQGDPIQPFILVIGTIFKQKEILVYFDNIFYKLHSILRSIEVCYNIFHLFNLEYPPESAIVWLFIQKYFFKFTSEYDRIHPKLTQILTELE